MLFKKKSIKDGELYYFMDTETYEQLPLNYSQVEEALSSVKENKKVFVKFYKGEASRFYVLKINNNINVAVHFESYAFSEISCYYHKNSSKGREPCFTAIRRRKC